MQAEDSCCLKHEHGPPQWQSLPPPTPSVEDIRERARELWELEGKQTDDANAYWHRANELLEAESVSDIRPINQGAIAAKPGTSA